MRSLARYLHRGIGMLLVGFITLLGISGALISYQRDLDAWCNRDLRALTTSAPALPLHLLIERVEAARKEMRVVAIPLESVDPRLLLLSISPKPGLRLSYDQIWVDAASGRILAQRKYNANVLDRRHLMPMIYRLHSRLLLGNLGNQILAAVAVLWLTTTGLGLLLAWPSHPGAWRKLWRIKLQAGRVWLDTHRLLGFLSAPLFVLITATGAWFTLDTLPNLFKPWLPQSDWPTSHLPEINLTRAVVTPAQALALAQAEYADARLAGLRLDYTYGLYQVSLRRPQDIGNLIEHIIFVDMREPHIVVRRVPSQRLRGDTVDAWLLPLHSGQAFGVVGRLVWPLLGCLPLILSVSGIYLWWSRRNQRTQRTHQAKAQDSSPQ